MMFRFQDPGALPQASSDCCAVGARQRQSSDWYQAEPERLVLSKLICIGGTRCPQRVDKVTAALPAGYLVFAPVAIAFAIVFGEADPPLAPNRFVVPSPSKKLLSPKKQGTRELPREFPLCYL